MAQIENKEFEFNGNTIELHMEVQEKNSNKPNRLNFFNENSGLGIEFWIFVDGSADVYTDYYNSRGGIGVNQDFYESLDLSKAMELVEKWAS